MDFEEELKKYKYIISLEDVKEIIEQSKRCKNKTLNTILRILKSNVKKINSGDYKSIANNMSAYYVNEIISLDNKTTIKIKDKTKSERMYDKGLELKKENNLSKSIIELKKSLIKNKHNCKSRNLLGLCYFEYGELSKALIEWSLNDITLENKEGINIHLRRVAKEASTILTAQKSIEKYNQGIISISNKDYTKGIINLETAIVFNNNFIEACNLLAVLYLSKNDDVKAIAYVEKVLDLDKNNKKAIKYKKVIGRRIGGTENSEMKIKKLETEQKKMTSLRFNDSVKEEKKKKRRLISNVTIFISGMLVMIIINNLVIRKIDLRKITVLEESIREKSNENKKLNIEKNQQLEDYKKNIKKAKEENEEILDAMKNTNASNIILNSLLLVNRQEFKKAAILINSIEDLKLKDRENESYNEVKKIAYERATEEYYEEGKEFYKKKDYINTISTLEKALKFSSKENVKIGDILYTLGNAYLELDEVEKSVEYYRILTDLLPNTFLAKLVSNKLDEVTLRND